MLSPFVKTIFHSKNKQKYLLCLDKPIEWQTGFQDPATSKMSAIIDFHDDTMCFIFFVVIFVSFMLILIVLSFDRDVVGNSPISNVTHNTLLEIVWTLVPIIILGLLALPSFALLYSMDEDIKPDMTIKVIGRQWY